MANFNSKKLNTSLTHNSAGGVAYKESLKAELATLLLTSFLSGNKAYQSNDEVMERLLELCSQMIGEDKTFLAKASLYARDKYQMRSVSHVVSAAILGSICQGGWSDEDKRMVRRYLSKVAMRPDDITETIACYSNRADAYKSKKEEFNFLTWLRKVFLTLCPLMTNIVWLNTEMKIRKFPYSTQYVCHTLKLLKRINLH